ncbi:MAG: putative toxin-antitoxin system toxin component, PIN family [Anaerolineales bacterium]
MKRLLVVFDTNVLFSGIGWQGSPYFCLQMARAGNIKSVTCLEILSEFNEKLKSKMGLTTAEAARAVAEILSFSELVKIENKLQVVASDPDDNKVVECAYVGKADFIVSGDRHLLELENYQGIPIVRANSFIERVLEK